MDLIQDQPMVESLIKSHDGNHILLLVVQIQNQLSDSIDLHLLAHEGEIIVEVVQVVRVRKSTSKR